MKAYLFPGQGSQFIGMGSDLYKKYFIAKKLFQLSNDILGFKITDIMFSKHSMNILKETQYTQLSIYIYSFIKIKTLSNFYPDMVSGHSLGEFSALAAINAFSFEEGLILVKKRAQIMQKICERISGGMAVILGLEDELVERVCYQQTRSTNGDRIVVPSNYNAHKQIVISGEYQTLKKVCHILYQIGAKKILYLPVHGAFHSPIMEPAKKALEKLIKNIHFHPPICPIYQNIHGKPVINCIEIKKNLIEQTTSPVKWKQSIKNMMIDGATLFEEISQKKFLIKMVKNIINHYDHINVK
ncbi:ACP S-malonyltransferase [Blattabacterium cuenoti]|uniref:ACP S-malonyltransferase n=1 Tax=Blattabacterium cuenoti TaxID=1653831 RepID=UPI00163C4349|nr:ACP S-malonyltransferase [Blattabacterium cuenoti]